MLLYVSYLPLHGRWSLGPAVKGSGWQMTKRMFVRSDGYEVPCSWKHKHTHSPCCSVLEWLDTRQCGAAAEQSEEGMQPETVRRKRVYPVASNKINSWFWGSVVKLRVAAYRQTLTLTGEIECELCRTCLKRHATCAGKVRQISAHEDTSKEAIAVKIKQVHKYQLVSSHNNRRPYTCDAGWQQSKGLSSKIKVLLLFIVQFIIYIKFIQWTSLVDGTGF